MVVQDNDYSLASKIKYYAGDYEEVYAYDGVASFFPTGRAEICYIRTPEGLQAAYKKSGIRNLTDENIYYFGRDHVGSITSIISQEGEVLERYLYDAWGNRRVIDDTSAKASVYYPLANLERIMPELLYKPLFDRGYIGEEHLDQFGLINLNARLYDPVLGRFLSPDPYVQAPENLQNFNRYAYGLNNPLMYLDPDGEKIKWWGWLLIGLGIDGISGGALSATLIGTLSAVHATAATTSMALSFVDFHVSLGKAMGGDKGSSLKNWAFLELEQLRSLVNIPFKDVTANDFEWFMGITNGLMNGETIQDNIGKVFGHAMNIGGKIDATGFYDGRLITRTKLGAIGGGISFGHYIFGDRIAMHPNDNSQNSRGLHLFAHEYGHTYQSQIMGPLYLFKVGIASAHAGNNYNDNALVETDANRRGFTNLGITPTRSDYMNFTESTYKLYEFLFAPFLYPFMWAWNY